MSRWRRHLVGLGLLTVGILLYSLRMDLTVEQYTKVITFDILDAFVR